MAEYAQGQPGADRAVGRPGPAARMTGPPAARPRPSVLIPPVASPGPGDPMRPDPGPTASVLAAPVQPAQAPTNQPAKAPANQPQAPATPRAPANQPQAPVTQPQQLDPSPARQATPPPPGSAPGAKAPKDQAKAPPTAAARAARSAVQPEAGARSARLFVIHLDPWSVMKQAFLLALALAVIVLVSTATLWIALDSAGVLDTITRTATDVGGQSGASVTSFLGFGKVMGAALIVAGIETVLVTALATLFAFMYNLAVGIGGGIEVTLSEDD